MEPLIELVRKFQLAQATDARNQYASQISSRIYARLSRFVRSRVPAANMADVVQEIFIAVFSRLSYFRGQNDESFLSWVYTIARRKIADTYRSGKTEQATTADPKILEESLAFVQSSAMSESDRAALRDAIELLKAADYPCLGWIWDRYVTGLSFVELGDEAGITEEAARKRVERCLELARTLVQK